MGVSQDCDPIQAGLDRLFCDIHCVRDAVVRGDRTILRNLKQALNRGFGQFGLMKH